MGFFGVKSCLQDPEANYLFRIQKVNGKIEAKLGKLKNMGVISSCEKQKLDKKKIFKLV